jgi:hypothetical protein
MSFDGRAAAPEGPFMTRMRSATESTFRLAGADLHMGLRLHRVIAGAGLPAPELLAETLIACGPEAPVWAWGNVARGLAPLMERLGVDGVDDALSPTLDQRLLAELWTRVPR